MHRAFVPSYNRTFSINTKEEMWENKEEDENAVCDESEIKLEMKMQFVMKIKSSWKMKMQSVIKMKSIWRIQIQSMIQMK